MAFDVNQATLIGRVGRDPESKNVGGKDVVNFSVATSYGSKDKSKTNWHQVDAWEKLATIVQQILHKGDLVYVQGRIDYNTTGEGTEKRTFTKIVATNVINLTGKPAGTSTTPNTTSVTTAPAAVTDDSDIPF